MGRLRYNGLYGFHVRRQVIDDHVKHGGRRLTRNEANGQPDEIVADLYPVELDLALRRHAIPDYSQTPVHSPSPLSALPRLTTLQRQSLPYCVPSQWM